MPTLVATVSVTTQRATILEQEYRQPVPGLPTIPFPPAIGFVLPALPGIPGFPPTFEFPPFGFDVPVLTVSVTLEG